MNITRKSIIIWIMSLVMANCAFTITPDVVSELGLLNAVNIQNNPTLDPTLPSATVSNLLTGGVAESGFLRGTAAPATFTNSPISSVEISLDGGAYTAVTGTTNWTYQLPTGASTWRRGSQHTIQVRATDENGKVSGIATLTVRKGRNKDINGDGYADLAIGANLYNSSTGRAYVFHSQGSAGIASGGAAAIANTILTGDTASDEFGYSVALGDVNGDGYADLIAGAYRFNSNDGRVYIFHSAGASGIAGGTAGTAASAIFTTVGAGAGPRFGESVELTDFNGDGYDDAALGTSNEFTGPGRVRVYHSSGAGGIAGGGTGTAATVLSHTVTANFGRSISAADVNGDGFADLLAGAPAVSGGGAAYLFLSAGGTGIAGGNESTAQAAITGEGSGTLGDRNGTLLEDLNGDGFADVMLGDTGISSSVGRAYIFYSAGASSITGAGAAAANAILSETGAAGRVFGASLAAGDADGDGFADLAVGAPDITQDGRSYLFISQGAAGIAGGNAPATPKLYAGNVNNNLGAAVVMLDLNGDGYSDFVTGARAISEVYIMNGGASGIADQDISAAGTVAATITGENAGDQFGFAIAR